jgi:hypothetical protein
MLQSFYASIHQYIDRISVGAQEGGRGTHRPGWGSWGT